MTKTKLMPRDLLDSAALDALRATNSEPPLPCVLLSIAYIEQCLGVLLHGFFIEGETSNQLLHHDKGLLGTLYARARLCYSLGLIDKGIFNNLTLLGEVRNLFAHSHQKLDFDDSDVSAACQKLTPPVIDIVLNGRPMPPESMSVVAPTDPKGIFCHTVGCMIHLLNSVAQKIDRCPESQTKWHLLCTLTKVETAKDNEAGEADA